MQLEEKPKYSKETVRVDLRRPWQVRRLLGCQGEWQEGSRETEGGQRVRRGPVLRSVRGRRNKLCDYIDSSSLNSECSSETPYDVGCSPPGCKLVTIQPAIYTHWLPNLAR
jgi:hypothetical protein